VENVKKATAVVLISVLLFGIVPFSHLASAQHEEKITIDGNLSDWASTLLVQDPVGDAKWADNDIKEVGLYSDGVYIYIAGVFKKTGYNNFGVMVDLLGRDGSKNTKNNPWGRRYEFVGGTIDLMIESWESGLEGWRIDSDGSFHSITENITKKYHKDGDWTVVEMKIPLSIFGYNTPSEVPMKAVFILTGGSGGGHQWFSDIVPDQNVPTWSENGGAEEPAMITKYILWSPLNPLNLKIVSENFNYQTYLTQKRLAFQNVFIMHNKFFGVREFERDYSKYSELDQKLKNMPLTDDMRKRLGELEDSVMDLLKLYNEGKELINSPNYAFSSSLKIYRAYTGLRKVVSEMEAMLEKAQSGELEKKKHMEELAKNLTKTIDGNLDDWDVEPVAVDETGYGQDGANLKALYVDYDDQFLYIALTTENKASWRIAYGISLDYKDGGYTTGQDSWARKVQFSKGIDAQLYFFWNGEFFGDKGTSNITSAQLMLWNGTGWTYQDLKWVGFYTYTGGAENGLQTLEIAIPWSALGGKPEKISLVAYVTGQGAGDSAVDSLPLQDAVKDTDPGQEWGDVDTFTEFATVTIE
jgi:hypothetical protein